MLNFFRKIRQQLSYNNKPRKYFRYAIGEIVLVVIGILIALQINNWNENRKLDIRKIEVNKSMASELKEMLRYTKSQIKTLDERIDIYTKLINEWDTLDPKTLSEYNLSYHYAVTHTSTLIKYTPRMGYYNSIINSGEISLIPDSTVVNLNYVYNSLRNDINTYVNQEANLHILIAEVVAKNHPKIFLSAKVPVFDFDNPYSKEYTLIDNLEFPSIIAFLNSIKDDGELKSLLIRNLTIIKWKRYLLAKRMIPKQEAQLNNFQSINKKNVKS